MIIIMGSYLAALVMDTERIPIKGETLVGKNFRQVHGGKGSNQAIQAARLGAEVKFMGAIGDDSFGKGFLDLCKTEGVDTKDVHISTNYPTGAGFIICGGGHNIITIDIGALHEFDEPYILKNKKNIGTGNIVLIQQEVPMESALLAAKTAHEEGNIVILNPAPAYDISNRDLSFVDYLTPNETEARICLGLTPTDARSDEEIAEKLLKLGCKNIVMTLGSKGCLIASQCECTKIKPYRIEKVIDSTGAGDSFNAALAVALSEGKSLIEASHFANATAALSCTKHDTIPSFHTRQEVENFINKNH